jgi:hypothetical protein
VFISSKATLKLFFTIGMTFPDFSREGRNTVKQGEQGGREGQKISVFLKTKNENKVILQ